MAFVSQRHAPIGPYFATAVSANGRYLVDQFGSPYLVNADTPWALAINLDAADQATYLAARQRQGFNTVIVDLVGSTTMGETSTGANWNGENPFTGTFTPNPTYWARIDTFFGLCQSYGFSVVALPADSYACIAGQVLNSMTAGQATTFGQFLAARYRASSYPGIMWMMGNDYSGDGQSGMNGNPSTTFYLNLIGGLQTSDTRLVTSELCATDTMSTDGTATGPSMTVNGVYNYLPTYEGVLRAYASNVLPAEHVEGAYENSATGAPFADLDLRKQPLWTLTSGGCGQAYGNDTYTTGTSSLWQFKANWASNLSSTITTARTAYMAAISTVAWWKCVPDTTSALVISGRGTALAYNGFHPSPQFFTNDTTYGHYVTAAYSSDGTVGLVYNPDSSVNTAVTLSAAVLRANPRITKVDPFSGATTSLGWTTTPSGGANAGGDHDWLYLITAT